MVFTNTIYHKRKITTDLAGKFPVTSNRVDKYLYVLYYCDRNIILVQPIKARIENKFSRFYKYLHDQLLTRGVTS